MKIFPYLGDKNDWSKSILTSANGYVKSVSKPARGNLATLSAFTQCMDIKYL